MQIDNTLILKLEQLARLELSDRERHALQGSLNAILKMVEQLNTLDTTGVEPLIYVSETENHWREDVVRYQVAKKAALSNAPNANEDYFKVPKVIGNAD
jgi:aspartyl-tRNA(Asn)/glutamyl-tRNA(Gln) amidotransferase subunit C